MLREGNVPWALPVAWTRMPEHQDTSGRRLFKRSIGFCLISCFSVELFAKLRDLSFSMIGEFVELVSK